MPTYEYRCPQGHEFELFQRMSDEPRAPCPECGVESQRMLSAGAGFLFKGDGFYITDYRSDSYKKAAKADAEKKGGSGSSPEGGAAPSGGGGASPSPSSPSGPSTSPSSDSGKG